jgi:type III restriction enzyme
MSPNAIVSISTAHRQRDSIGISALRREDTTVFLDDNSMDLSDEDSRSVLQAVVNDESLPHSAWEKVENAYQFKTPLNVVIADHKPEREFTRRLIRSENATMIDAWIKSTDRDFYPIEYAWRKGEHPKRGFFNPDLFVKVGSHILVVEIKGEEELAEPSDENKGKYKAAMQHFEVLNTHQSERLYHFNFLTPKEYDKFFKFVRDGNYSFVSELDVALGENGS